MQEVPSRPIVADEQLATPSSQPTPVTQSTITQKGNQMKKLPVTIMLVAGLVAIAGGVATGWGSFGLFAKQSSSGQNSDQIPMQQVAGSNIKAGDVYGSGDSSTFADFAEGYLESGGIDGEGSHKLLRSGGPSQTVYLTSSVTDLEKLVGMEVKIWGETFKGQKAGWLMDVGKIEVVNPKAEPPQQQ